MTDNTMPGRRLRRSDASRYLNDTWGIQRAPSTLAKLAVQGGGPKFENCGRGPLYLTTELDSWARAKISGLMESTSSSVLKTERLGHG